MGNYDKKDIIKKAEKIIEDYNKRDKEERKEKLNLKREFKRLRRINIGLKIVIAVMAIVLTAVIL